MYHDDALLPSEDANRDEHNDKNRKVVLGAPRVMKNDIRRSFAKMYLNAINCGDFQRLQDFSSTFVLPTCQFNATLCAKEEFRLPTFLQGVGPRTPVHHLLGCFVMFPDMVLTMGDTKVVTSNCWAGTQVVIPFDCRFTKTHHIPTECWIPPPEQVEQMYAEPSVERMMAALSVQDTQSSTDDSTYSPTKSTMSSTAHIAMLAKKRKRAGLTPYDQVPPSYADTLLAGAVVVPEVPKLYAKGTYVIHLDERHHVERITLDFSQLDDEV